jgi:5-methylcytosine-specific restriction endonuclease McrA
MTTYIPEAMRRAVIRRAQQRCEYCRVHQTDRLFTHEIDHIIAEKHGGETEESNLSLACSECNRYKSSDLCSLDTVTKTIVALLHPRTDTWRKHFRRLEGMIDPLTPRGG